MDENNQKQSDPINELAQNTLSSLKKDYITIGKSRVRPWHAWAAMGILAGVVLALAFISNKSGEFSASEAARRTPATAVCSDTFYKILLSLEPTSKNQIKRGSTNVSFAKIKLTNNGCMELRVTGFSVGSDSDLALRTFANIKLFDGSTQLDDTAPILELGGTMDGAKDFVATNFMFPTISLKPKSSKVFTITADVLSDAPIIAGSNGRAQLANFVHLGLYPTPFTDNKYGVFGPDLPVFGPMRKIIK